MQTLALVVAGLALVVALVAFYLACRPILDGRAAFRVTELELELANQGDLLNQALKTMKKINGRNNVRDNRESKDHPPPASTDPLDRLPGETAAQWKERANKSIGLIRRQ